MQGNTAIIVLIEGVMVLGGALLFGWWQLRSVKRDQAEAARRKAEAAKAQAEDRPPP